MLSRSPDFYQGVKWTSARFFYVLAMLKCISEPTIHRLRLHDSVRQLIVNHYPFRE